MLTLESCANCYSHAGYTGSGRMEALKLTNVVIRADAMILSVSREH